MNYYSGSELFEIKGICKKQGYLKVDNTDIKLPFTLISGRDTGKTILITAGVHGGEYVGIETSKRLAKEIDENKLLGKVIIIHTTNCSGFRERLAGVTYEDGENLNRIFPGDENGNTSERLSYFILNSLSKKVDFYIDIHGADIHGDIIPTIFYPVAVEEKVAKLAKAAADYSGFPNLIASTAKNGSYSRAALEGTPAILMELGGMGIWSEEQVNIYTNRLMNVLNFLDMYRVERKDIEEIIYYEPVEEIMSKEEGFWYPKFKVGDEVVKGERIGEIRDVFDGLLGEYFAPFSGVVIYQTVALSTKKDSFLTAIAKRLDK